MFGSSGKFGRGGGGAGRGGGPPKRGGLHNPFPPPQPSAQRLSGPPRAPIGAASRRMQSGSGPGAAPLPAAEETFRLVSKSPLSFGMIIRLTPDLVEEIRRVEAQGGTARIKFDSNANNVSGNVIEVGGKDFSFQWSSELGDCDIYEETVSGEDGNGLLVESGSAWRKLNVQRVLDENIKNHVKMRSEEAERKLKSRKAIVLDPANPSVKNQAKTMAAASVESNMRRMPFKPKKEPAFKKRKVEPNPVAIAGPSKPVFKSGTSSISSTKNRFSVSPLPSTPEQPVASSSPFAVGNSTSASKPRVINRDDATNSDREMPNRTFPSAAGEASRNKHSGSASLDLPNTLITLLMGKPQGMDFKEIEKAVGDKHPDFRMDIEAVLKKIAHYQYPGKYILNAGVEIESVKKPSLESGSSPECTDEQIPVVEALSLAKTGAGEFDRRTQLNLNMGEEPNPIENIDIQSTSPDLFTTDKRMNNNSEGGGSSSESGSDSESSDSDSSDSGSESGSQSKSRSRSPAGSGSASSSDSESDGSSSSKEGFDDDVDIMVSDDDDRIATEKKLQASELLLLSSPKTFRDGHPHDGMDETREGDQIRSSALDLNDVGKYDDMSDEVDIDDLPNNNNVKIYQNHETEEGESTDWLSQAANRRSQEEEMPLSPGEYKPFDNERVSNFGFNEVSGNAIKQRGGVMQTLAKDNLDYEHHDSSEKVSRPKSKRASDPNRFQRKSESAKSLKEKETMADKNERGENTYSSSEPARFLAYENANRSHSNADFVNSLFTDVQQPAQRGDDHKTRDKLPAIADRPSKRVENLSRNSKNFERFSAFPDESDNAVSRGNHFQDKLPVPRDKLHSEREDEDNNAFEKSALRNESGSGTGDRFSTLPDSHYRKSGKISGKGKDGVHAARMHTASSNKENGKPDIDRGNILRREPSDLELGEFREPVPEETQGSKRQFERKSSFKVENKSNTTDNLHSDSNKGKPVGKTAQELKIQSPIHGDNQDKFHPRNILEDDFEDSVRSQQRTVPAVTKQFPRPDHVDPEAGSQWDRLSDVAGKAKKNVGKTNQGTGLEGHAGTARNSKNGCPVVGSNSKETKKHKSNPLTDLVERKDTSFENNTNGRNKRESSSDEDDSFYLKYDKDEPELKGVIQDHAQYKEYVKEYREKYDSYCSLDGTLKNYRNDFEKLGHELNLAKGRDSERYYRILEQISENYLLCIPRVKRMKKVFIVLHEELKQLKERIRDYAVACGKD